MSRNLQWIPQQAGRLRLLGPIVALAAAVCPAGAQPTNTFSDLPCAVFLDLPAPAGSATPFLPFTVPLCGGGQVNVTTRSHPLRPAPYTDEPYYTGTFSHSLAGDLKELIDPAVNPGDFDGRYQSRTTVGWDLLLDFDVPIASFGMSTMMSRLYNNISDRMRLYDGPLGSGNLVAEVFSQGNPVHPYWHAVRFTGHDAGSPVIRSVVLDVQSDVDARLFIDGLAFGPAQPGTLQDEKLGDEEKRRHTMDTLRATFKPEFLNRIDDIITFRPLGIEDIDRIILIQLALIQKRLDERKLAIELTEKAKHYIAKEGYSPVYGARPLKRALQKRILDHLALKILDGSFKEGDEIQIDLNKQDEIVFKKK